MIPAVCCPGDSKAISRHFSLEDDGDGLDDGSMSNLIPINGRIFPLESADKFTDMFNRIQDMTYFADNSGIKSCHLFLLF